MADADALLAGQALVCERFFTHAPDLLCVADTAGYFRRLNPAWERALGWTAAEMMARPYIELVHPDDVEMTREAAGALARQETVVRFVNRFRCKSGGYRRLEWSSVASGADGLVYATARDVTEASRDRLHLAEIEAVAQIGSWELDLDGGALYWSPITHAIHETDPATFQPHLGDGLRYFPPEARALLDPALERLTARGEPYDLELPFVTDRGRRRWVRVTSTAEVRGGRVTRVFGTIQDVTERRAEAEALRLREERHRLAMCAVGVGVFDIYVGSRMFTLDTHARALLFGGVGEERVSLAELLGQIHPEDRERVDAAAAVIRRGELDSIDVSFRCPRPGGGWSWIRARGTVVTWGPDGAPKRALGTVLDVTATRELAEERARRTERVDQLMSACPATVYAVDPAWRLSFISSTSRELFGAAPEAIVRDPGWWARSVHPDDLEEALAVTQRWRAGGAVGTLRHCYRIRGADGGYIWIEDSLRALRDSSGAPVEFAGAFVDVSERRRQEEAIAAAHHRLQATLDAIPDILLDIDADGRFVGYHALSTEQLSMPPERFLGRLMEEVMPPEVAALGRVVMREACERGRSATHRYAMCSASGVRWFEMTAARRPAAHPSDPGGVVCLTRDITDRHEAEVELRAARERAEQASAAKSSFLANMSHEIRTPMNGLLGMIEALERVITEPEHRRYLAVLRDSGEGLLTILNDILDVSKIEAGKMTIEVLPFRPRELVRKIESVHRFKARERGLELEVVSEPCGEEARLGDPHRILQVLHNLVSNAIKFTERGRVAVAVECAPGGLRLAVRDTGIGMTEAQVARIFEDFEQGDPSVTRRYGGTGLGMSIVRRLVGLMGGEIKVESRLGVGTTIQIDLPLPPAPPAAPEAAAVAAEEAGAGARLGGLRVLAVDDSDINRMVLAGMLGDLAVDYSIAGSGAEAIARVEAERFDVLLLDISMPEMDGVETLTRVRAVEARAGRAPAVAVAVTAHAFEHEVRGYLAAGFDSHLAKPFRSEALRRSLLRAAPRG